MDPKKIKIDESDALRLKICEKGDDPFWTKVKMHHHILRDVKNQLNFLGLLLIICLLMLIYLF